MLAFNICMMVLSGAWFWASLQADERQSNGGPGGRWYIVWMHENGRGTTTQSAGHWFQCMAHSHARAQAAYPPWSRMAYEVRRSSEYKRGGK